MRNRHTPLVSLVLLAALTGCTESPGEGSTGTSNQTPDSASTSESAGVRPAWAPTGELVYVSLPADLGEDEFVLPVLHRINAEGSGERKLPLSAYAATWSHDGSRLLANDIPVSHGGSGPWRPGVVDPDGRVVRLFRLPDQRGEIWNCRWTPDEKAMVCAIGGIVRIDLATGKVTRLTTGHDQVWDVSADGRIAFVHQVAEDDNNEDVRLFTMGVDGSGKRQLTEYGELDGNFDDAGGSWLPDSSAIVAATPAGDLVEVDATTGQLTEIPLDEPLFAGHPDVSPDGTEIAFQAPATGGDIYATPITGGPVALVTGTAADERRAEWRPAPTSTPSGTTGVLASEGGRIHLRNGRTVPYQCTGTGSPPILLEAGSDVGGTEQYSDALIDPLAAHTRVCTYDRPGTGQTTWLPNGWRPLDEVCRIENQVADGLHLKTPYVLFGQSGGAGMAMGCARRHPERIAALVLVEAGVDDPDELAKIPGFTDLSNSPEHLNYIDITREVNAIAAPIGDFPVLVLSAADEGGAKSQRQWLVLSPHSRQVVVEGGHNLQDDNPEALDREILALLGRLREG